MEKYILTNDNINSICDDIEKSLANFQVERHEALRIKLMLEEELLAYQSHFGTTATCIVRCIKRISFIKVEVIIPGESYNPFEKIDEEDELTRSLLAGIGIVPTRSYKLGNNRIIFTAKKKPLSDTTKIIFAIILSIIAGSGLSFLPKDAYTGINDYFLTPTTNSLMGLISAVSGPLIFCSVLGSICSMGNLENFGKIGSKIIKTIIGRMLFINCLVAGAGFFIYNIELSNGGNVNFSQVLDLIYGIVPSNLFEPFINGNTMQLIFIAVMVGLAMLALSTKVNIVFNLVEQISSIIQTIMTGLSSAMPILIFLLFTCMLSNGNLEMILDSWKLLTISIFMMAIFYVVNFLQIAFRKKVSPVLLFKKVFPTFIILLTTASSSAAFTTNTKDAVKKLGIHKQMVEFGIPLGQVLFMPDILFVLFGMEITFATSCGIPITIPWLLIGFLTNLIVAFAVPPIPGGMLMGLTVVFTQLGIPLEMMGIALAICSITDFPGTAINGSGWQLTLIEVADELDMLDHDVLQK